MNAILHGISKNRRLTLAIGIVVLSTIVAQLMPTYSWAVTVQASGAIIGFILVMSTTKKADDDEPTK